MQFKELPESINGFKIIKDLGRINGKTRKALVECKVCYRHYEAQAYYLKDRKHCGCLRPPEMNCSYRKSHPRLVRIYKCMRSRCYYKKDICFKNYGQKGIKICNEWLNNPDSFCSWSLQNGYDENLSIDRKNNSLDYSPENCQWSDSARQARNRKGIKLTMEKAKAIRKEIYNFSIDQLATKYDVKNKTILRVLRNERWKE